VIELFVDVRCSLRDLAWHGANCTSFSGLFSGSWISLYTILRELFLSLHLSLLIKSYRIEDFKEFKEIFVPVWKANLQVTVKQ
jgi:hypothetical protein